MTYYADWDQPDHPEIPDSDAPDWTDYVSALVIILAAVYFGGHITAALLRAR